MVKSTREPALMVCELKQVGESILPWLIVAQALGTGEGCAEEFWRGADTDGRLELLGASRHASGGCGPSRGEMLLAPDRAGAGVRLV